MATSILSSGTTAAAPTAPPPLTGADAAFQGIADVVVGSAQIVRTPTLDTITVSTPNSVINFTPFDTANGGGPITFLPAGRTGLFQNDPNSGVANFTVLNRIIPTDTTRAIRFDGTVQSRIATAIGGSTPGGTILFYSPGGIIASSTAVFDVGSLVLSAADISSGQGSNAFSFSGANSGAAVDINNGASIRAQGSGSFVALVAPRVIQSGTVKSDGSVGYIAAEAVDVTIKNNLFDISFVTGTGSSAAITHTGTTELTRASNDTVQQRIYVAAVPKNDAITTLVSGTLGYTAATTASIQNGAIILSAGRNVSDSGYGAHFTDFNGSNALSNITVGADTATVFNASLLTNTTGDALIAPAAGTTVEFNDNVILNADRLAEVKVVANSSAIFSAGLSVISNNLRGGAAARVMALGEVGYGNTGYGASAGTIRVGDALLISGGPSLQGSIVQNSVAELIADRGHIFVGGTTEVTARDDSSENGVANAFGGNALVRVGAAGSELTLGKLNVSATAVAGTAIGERETLIDGNATGGSARIEVSGGNLSTGDISAESDAFGRPRGIAAAGSTAFVASGGTTHVTTVSLSASASNENNDNTQLPSPITASTPGLLAPSNSTGSQTLSGGTIQLDIIDTTVNINGDLILNAEAAGSQGLGGVQGGTIGINLDNGNLRVGDSISASVSAEETAFVSNIVPDAIRGGTVVVPEAVRGGSIWALVSNNSELLASAMNFSANAANGGDATAGIVVLATDNMSRIRSTGTLAVDANATILNFGFAGDALGGGLLIDIASGAFDSGPLTLNATAVGGNATAGGVGGTATGGTAQVRIIGGDNIIESFSLTTNASGGRGGNGDEGIGNGGAGGNAFAGTSEVDITGGTVRTAGLVLTSSATSGAGGNGILGGAGGSASGGRAALFTSEDANVFLTKLPTNPQPSVLVSSVNASARGGAGGSGQSMAGGAGGTANGGAATLTLAGADIDANTARFAVGLTVNSEAAGGVGGASNDANGGAGGSAAGGVATLNLINNQIDFANVALGTRGSGGSGGSAGNAGYGVLPAGGAGGNGSGGLASVYITAPATSMVATNIANIAIASEAVGGNGGAGANGGAGGNAINDGSARFTHTGGKVTVPVAILTTNSFAGRGGLGLGGSGGNGGNGFGGNAAISASGNTQLALNVLGLTANSFGGAAGQGSAILNTQNMLINGANGGNATGGTASLSARNGAVVTLGVASALSAEAFAGNGRNGINGGVGGSGGVAQGGVANLFSTSSAAISGTALTLSVNATGGVGGNGGNGIRGVDGTPDGANGIPGIDGIGGTVSPTAAALAIEDGGRGENGVAGGDGGIGGNGGSGGLGTAGQINIDVSNQGRAEFAGTLTLTANGFGGLGGIGGDGGAGGNGSNGGNGGQGGAGAAGQNGGNGGAGGDGGSAGNGGSAGMGGGGNSGMGGTISLMANGGSLTTVMLAATANGMGVIGQGGGNGGLAGTPGLGGLGGTGGAGSAPGVNGMDGANGNNGAAGNDGTTFVGNSSGVLGAGGTITIAAQRDTGGNFGALNLGNGSIEATGRTSVINSLTNQDIMLGQQAGTVRISNLNGAGQAPAVSFTDLNVRAVGAFPRDIGRGGGIFIDAGGSAITASGNVSLFTDESIGITATNAGQFLVTGDVSAEASKLFNVSHDGRPAADSTLLGNTVNLISGGAFNAIPGTRIRSNNDLNITSRLGSVSAGDLNAGDNITVQANTLVNISGLVQTTGNVAAGFESDISIIAPGDVTVNMIDALGNFNVTGAASLTANGSITAGEDVTLSTSGMITTQAISAGDDILATAGNGTISILSATASGTGPDDERNGANIGLNATNSSVSLGTGSAATDIDVIFGASGLIGSATAGNAINLSGSGNASFTSLTSGDATTIMAGGMLSGGTANAGGLLSVMADVIDVDNLTSSGSDVLASARVVDIGTTSASRDAIIDTKGLENSSITLGSINANRDIAINGGSNGISITTIRAGDDIDIGAAGNTQISTAIAADTVTIAANGASGVAASLVQADRGDIFVTGAGMANFDGVAATLGRVQLIGNRISANIIRAGSDVAVSYNEAAMIGSVGAGATIQASGMGSLEFTDLRSVGATILNAGGAILGRGGAIITGTNFTSTSTGGFINTGAITASTTATIMANRVNSGDITGGTGIMLRASDSITAGTLSATANEVNVNAVNGISLGNTSAGSSISITNVNNAITTGALTAGSDVTIANGGSVSLTSASVADDLRIISGAGVTLATASTRGGSDQDGDGNDIVVRATGPISIMSATTMPNALATSDVMLTSTAGSINAGTLMSRGAATLNAATGLILNTATSGRNILLTGQSINATMLTAATDIEATAGGAMAIGTARAMGGNLSLTAAGTLSAMNGDASGNTLLTSTNGGNISSGTLSSGTGDIVITSDGNATMTGSSSAGRNLNVTARNLISIGGVANGAAIDLKSSDITINTTSGRIGEQGRTTVVQLTNSGTGVTTIGGAGVATGFSLSNAEAQRIFAGDIIFTASRAATPAAAGTQDLAMLNTAAPDVVLDTLTLAGATGQTGATGGNIAATGRLRIETPGKLRTVGVVSISNLATTNRFQVNAAQSIEVDAATGSVSLTGAAGALTGTIELTAPTVIAAGLPAIAAVAAAVDGRAINDRLAINDNAISDIGTFSANAIIATVSNGFFVQNSGIKELSAFSFGDRRGVTVGTGGLTINASSPATRIFFSGRQLQPNGTFITGVDFLRAQTINGTRIQLSTFPPTPFDPASTINGCAIINSAACLINIDGGSLARDVVGQSDDDGGGSSERNGSGNNDFVRFEFKSLDQSTFAAVIDDPVTSVGNDDLYALYDARDCNDDQSLESCAKPDNGAKPQ